MLNVRTDDTLASVSTLGGADPAVLDRDELAALTNHVRAIRAFAVTSELHISRRIAELSRAGHAEPVESMLINEGGQSSQEAHTTAVRERACCFLPSFESALADATITVGHIDAVAAALRGLSLEAKAQIADREQKLLDDARLRSVDNFTRNVRRMVREIQASIDADSETKVLERQIRRSAAKRRTDNITGMRITSLELDPQRDATMWNIIDAVVASLQRDPAYKDFTYPQLTAAAFVEAIGNTGVANRVPEISVLIDLSTLRNRLADTPADNSIGTNSIGARDVCETIDGTRLPVERVREMCCEADILPIVLASDGQTLEMGRAIRVASRSQRRALAAMYVACAHPDCHVMFSDCRIHHVIPWERNGPTDLSNLLPLCSRHHHLVHEGRWTLTMRPDRFTTWTRPDGVQHWAGRQFNRRPDSSRNNDVADETLAPTHIGNTERPRTTPSGSSASRSG